MNGKIMFTALAGAMLLGAGLMTGGMALSPAQAAGSEAVAAATIKVENPYARPPMGGAKVAAAYMTLKNTGKEDDKLVRAEGDVSERIELHTHVKEQRDGQVVMKMRQVPYMEVPAGGETVLKPGGLHIMLIGVRKDLKPGDVFDLTLVFEKAGKVQVQVPVKKVSATMMHMMKQKMQGMQHGGMQQK